MRAVRNESKDDMKGRAKLMTENTITGMLEQEKKLHFEFLIVAGLYWLT